MSFAKAFLADGGCDAGRSRAVLAALAALDIEACIPSTSNQKAQVPHDRAPYRRRHRIEAGFGELTHWRRIHARSDRRATPSTPAIAIAAIVAFRT